MLVCLHVLQCTMLVCLHVPQCTMFVCLHTCTPVYHIIGVSTCYIVFTTSSHKVQDVPSHSVGPHRDVKGKGKMTRVSSPPVMPPNVLPTQHTPSLLGPDLHSQSMVCIYLGFVYCFIVYCVCLPTIVTIHT